MKVAPGTSYAHTKDSSCEISDFEEVNNVDENNCTSPEIDEPIECPVSKTYSVDDFVIFNYMGTLFPGIIVKTSEEGAVIHLMEKTKQFYKWPAKTDELLYSWKDIVVKIKSPILIRRGYFKVRELETYTE